MDFQTTGSKKSFRKTKKVKRKQTSKHKTNQVKLDQSKAIDDWSGKSAIAKFFPTEISDEEEGQNEEDSFFNFSPLNSPRNSKANVEISKTTPTLTSKYNPEQGINDNRKVNIDLLPNETFSLCSMSDDTSCFDCPRLIRHGPVISTMAESGCFIPKIKTKSENIYSIKTRKINKHNCNDENDVTRNWTKTAGMTPKNHEDHCIPMSVISERYQDQIYTPTLPKEELYRFGEVYESNLLHLIHKYLEVDSFHRVVYVGPEKGSIASQVENYFCLVNGIMSIYPGKIEYADIKDNKKLLAFKIAHIGAEDFFSQAAKDDAYKKAPFHRVIFHDAVHYFNDMEKTFENLLKVLHKFGKILIIYRAGSLNTLPYFKSARKRITEDDIPYMKIITALQNLKADVEWDLVHVPIVIPTSKWFAMLKAKYPPQMEIMSNYEITCGLRELSEGPLKYLQGSEMELEDRLMFITASLPTFDCAYPSVQRVGGASQVPYAGSADAKYYLPVTDDMKLFLKKSNSFAQKPKTFF